MAWQKYLFLLFLMQMEHAKQYLVHMHAVSEACHFHVKDWCKILAVMWTIKSDLYQIRIQKLEEWCCSCQCSLSLPFNHFLTSSPAFVSYFCSYFTLNHSCPALLSSLHPSTSSRYTVDIGYWLHVVAGIVPAVRNQALLALWTQTVSLSYLTITPSHTIIHEYVLLHICFPAFNHIWVFLSVVFVKTHMNQMDGCEEIKTNNCMEEQMSQAVA